jgi:large subunit ribosomal protein L30e
MKKVDNIPEGTYTIGIREIGKDVKAGKVKKIIVAKNCPKEIISKLEKLEIEMEIFTGDQIDMGTKLGKPFPVASVGIR